MRNRLSRRCFLRWAGAGTAVALLPTLAARVPRAQLLGQTAGARGAHQTYFDRFGIGSGLLERVLDRALAHGGDFSEIYLEHTISHWTGMEDDQVNRAYSSVDLGAGIRILKGDATGFAYCEDLTEQALLSAASTAAAVADAERGVSGRALQRERVVDHVPIDIDWAEVGVERKLPIIERANATIRARDARIVKTNVFLADVTKHILVATSEGRLVEDALPMCMIYAQCVAMENGRVETGGASASQRHSIRYFRDTTIDRIATRAADWTTMLFEAVPAPVGEMPVVLAPGNSAILLHEAIGHGMEADFNRKGISIYADRLGARIAPRGVTIVDDGTCDRLGGTLNIDDEGETSQRTLLVEDGILRTYMHDRISARHYGVAPTGSGRRQSFRYPPNPRMRNTYMASGSHDPREIIASVKKGIYAEHVLNGEVAIGAGDFAFYLKHGRMIENGRLTHIIKDANLIGNGPKVLEQMDMVGNDLAFYSGAGMCGKDGQGVPVGFGMPTVRAGGISVGGRKA
ncbi:MAG: TldD/PmbA family protein [Candidatus Eisenbacteria bacterium]|nr:TldD/PmbA family protein [Candidatus Eisenbacteria bacterium]